MVSVPSRARIDPSARVSPEAVLAPSVETMKLGQAADTPAKWSAFARKYRAEMSAPAPSQALDVLAAISKTADFSVGCYCEDEAHCHRSVLRALLVDRSASLVD